jgi:lipopolysaccharide export system protein LptA
MAAGLAAWVTVAAAAEPATAPKAAAGEEDLTVITSEKLTFDYTKKFAIFEQNVVVTDPQIRLLADKLTVTFDENDRARTIRAEGQVYIVQEDKRAKSKLATYDVVTGKITLEGDPTVTRGADTLSGKTITYWRDDNRVLVDGSSRLIIKNTDKEKKSEFLGPAPRK